ncbi:MAG: hypothetical protein PHG20_01930 [Geobacteraceae bacterium]|nr:hypothetical protein [Geobacteraceae bacterium]
MSTEFLFIIPAAPCYVPPPDMRARALDAFKKMLPTADEVDAIVHNEIRFIDAGARFETVRCPICDSELDQIWWGDAMNIAHRSAFRDLKVKLPCCDSQSTLDNLQYKMPSGFAQFLLQAREPGPGRYLTVDKLQALESILGTPLKQVWAQYKNNEKSLVRTYRAREAASASRG